MNIENAEEITAPPQGEEIPREEPMPSEVAGDLKEDPTFNSGEEGSEKEKTEEFKQLKTMAIKFLYGDRYEKMLNMFEQSGAQGFAKAIATAINTAIDHVQKQTKSVDHEMAALLGMDLYLKLIEDMMLGEKDGKKLVENLGDDHMHLALTETIKMYAKSHEDVTEQDMAQLLQEIEAGAGQQSGGPQAQDQSIVEQPMPEQAPQGGMLTRDEVM